MTRAELAAKVADILKISNVKADVIVSTVLDGLKRGLMDDGNVILRGFGRFQVHQKQERAGRNPKTGEPATIAARKVVKFKAGRDLKGLVNN